MDVVVRITSDCPCADANIIDEIIKNTVEIIIAIILVITATIGIFIWTKLNKINYEKISKEDIEISAGVEENLKEYRNIAIFGIDTRENTYSGSRKYSYRIRKNLILFFT